MTYLETVDETYTDEDSSSRDISSNDSSSRDSSSRDTSESLPGQDCLDLHAAGGCVAWPAAPVSASGGQPDQIAWCRSRLPALQRKSKKGRLCNSYFN